MERGRAQISFAIAFTPETEVKLENALVENGQLVEVELEVAVQNGGTLPGIDGTLTSPVSVTLHPIHSVELT